MKHWSLVFFILFVQETVTLNGLLLKTYQKEYSLLFISLSFIVTTTIDILVGYCLGKYSKRKWNKGKVGIFAKKWTERFHAYVGEHGRKVYLLFSGYFTFPYLNAFITAWLDIPFWESFWYLLIGNMIFYTTSWLLVLGVASVSPNPVVAFVVVIVLTVLVTAALRFWKARKI